MLYACNNPITQLLSVGHFTWNARSLGVEPRPFSALAIRLKGSGTLSWCGKSIHLEPGDVLYMPQGLSYHTQYSDTDLLLFHFVTAVNDPEPELYRLRNPEVVVQQFEKALGLWEKKEAGYLSRCMSIFYRILSLLAENEAAVHLPPHFLQAVEYMQSNCLSSHLLISQVCQYAGISETLFRQLYKRHFGLSPVAHLTQLRLEQAQMLISEGVSIEQAALESGFSDSKYFSRVVKSRLGCTPRQLKSLGK